MDWTRGANRRRYLMQAAVKRSQSYQSISPQFFQGRAQLAAHSFCPSTEEYTDGGLVRRISQSWPVNWRTSPSFLVSQNLAEAKKREYVAARRGRGAERHRALRQGSRSLNSLIQYHWNCGDQRLDYTCRWGP
jgi:hypothetical protein